MPQNSWKKKDGASQLTIICMHVTRSSWVGQWIRLVNQNVHVHLSTPSTSRALLSSYQTSRPILIAWIQVAFKLGSPNCSSHARYVQIGSFISCIGLTIYKRHACMFLTCLSDKEAFLLFIVKTRLSTIWENTFLLALWISLSLAFFPFAAASLAAVLHRKKKNINWPKKEEACIYVCIFVIIS